MHTVDHLATARRELSETTERPKHGHTRFRVAGLTCASDAILLERRLAWVDGVVYVMANPLNELVYITFDESRTSVAELMQRVDESEFGPVIPGEHGTTTPH